MADYAECHVPGVQSRIPGAIEPVAPWHTSLFGTLRRTGGQGSAPLGRVPRIRRATAVKADSASTPAATERGVQVRYPREMCTIAALRRGNNSAHGSRLAAVGSTTNIHRPCVPEPVARTPGRGSLLVPIPGLDEIARRTNCAIAREPSARNGGEHTARVPAVPSLRTRNRPEQNARLPASICGFH